MRKLVLASLAMAMSFSLTACGGQSEALVIKDAVIYSPFPGQTTASAYFTIEGASKGDRLLSVSSSLSDRVEIHSHIKNGDVVKMVRVDGLDMNGEPVEFKPGGYHVMIFNAEMDGVEASDLVLNFEKSGSINVKATITDRSGSKKKRELTEEEKDWEYGSAH